MSTRSSAEILRREVDEALDHPVADLGAEAAVGALLVLVREDRGERVLDVLDPVRPDDLRERVAVRARAELEVRAVVVDARDAHRLERAVVVEGERGVVVAVGAAVVVVRDVRDAILDVLHGAAGDHREEGREDRHLVHEELRAEAAAGRHRHEAQLARRDLQRHRVQPQEVREVHRVAVDREHAGAAVVVGDRAVRVHRHAGRARPVELGLHGAVGLGEGLVDLAERERALVGDVRAHLLVHERAALRRAPRTGRARRAAARSRPRSGRRRPPRCSGSSATTAATRLAEVAHLLDRDDVLDDRTGAERRQRIGALGDVLAGHDGDHAGQLLGRLGADREDLGVRVRAADDRRMRHAGQLDVVDVAALAAQEARDPRRG